MNIITVWYNSNEMIVFKIVADRLGLKNGYRIKSEEEFWNILSQNATSLMLLGKAMLHEQN